MPAVHGYGIHGSNVVASCRAHIICTLDLICMRSSGRKGCVGGRVVLEGGSSGREGRVGGGSCIVVVQRSGIALSGWCVNFLNHSEDDLMPCPKFYRRPYTFCPCTS